MDEISHTFDNSFPVHFIDQITNAKQRQRKKMQSNAEFNASQFQVEHI